MFCVDRYLSAFNISIYFLTYYLPTYYNVSVFIFFYSSVYCYRVLTPTMYRSRMASARQAVSMDYDDDSGAVKKARLRREGPSMRGPSPLLRPGKLLKAQRSSGENSFDLELGASATRVHQQQLHSKSKSTQKGAIWGIIRCTCLPQLFLNFFRTKRPA